MTKRRLLKVLAPLAAILVVTAVALAYFSSTGSGNGSASTGTISSPGTPTVPANSDASVPVNWTASSFSPSNPSADNDITYTVQRSSNGGSTWGTPSGTCNGSLTGTSCSDTATDGTYIYRVIAHFHTWTATSGESSEVDVDATDPTVTSIEADDASPTKATSVQYTVTFSEPVQNVDSGDFVVTEGGGVSGAGVSNVTGSGDTRTVTVGTGIGNGTVRLDLDDNGTITDAVGNALAGGDFTTGDVYTIDKTAPTVSSINRADASPTNATSVQYTVTFSESVIGVGQSDFALTTTGTISGAGVTSVTGSGATRTVTVNTGSGDGTIRLDLDDDGSITDPATNPLAGGDFTTGQVYTIDKTAPTAQSIDRADASPTKASSVNWTVTFSESVTGVDSADFALAQTGGVSGASITNVTGSGSSYTVTASTGTGSGTLGLNLVDNDTIADSVGNGLTAGFTGQTYTLDKAAPAYQSIARASTNPTDASSVDYLVTFTESVTGVDATDFTLSQGGGLSGASITGVTGSGSTRTVSVNTGSGDGTIQLNGADDDSITDAVGNPLGGAGTGNGSATGEVYTVDKSNPTVSSINRANPSPTNATSVDFTVTFSESVTGVDTTDFNLATAGITGASVTGVTGSGATRTVSVNTGTGDGTIRLDLIDDDTIVDGNGRQLGGAGVGNGTFNTGQSYTIDKTAPALQTLTMFDDDVDGRVDRVTAQFNDTLASPYTAGNAPWTLTNAPSGATLNSVALTNSTTLTLTLNEGVGAQNTAATGFTVAMAQNANGARDAVGNQSSFSATTPVDSARPIPISFADGNGTTDGLAQPNDTFTVTFSEPVANSNPTSTNVVLQGGATGGAADTISIPGLQGITASMGRADYVSGNNNVANFNNSTLSSPAPNQLRVTLSTCTGTGCSGANANSTASAAANFTYTPANGIADLVTPTPNTATSNRTQSILLF